MRKHFYLITEHEETDRVGCVSIMDSRMSRPKKGAEAPIRVLDEEIKDFRTVGQQVHLGYHDFEDEAAYEDDDRLVDVMEQKVKSVDRRWAAKAGIEEVIYDA